MTGQCSVTEWVRANRVLRLRRSPLYIMSPAQRHTILLNVLETRTHLIIDLYASYSSLLFVLWKALFKWTKYFRIIAL